MTAFYIFAGIGLYLVIGLVILYAMIVKKGPTSEDEYAFTLLLWPIVPFLLIANLVIESAERNYRR